MQSTSTPSTDANGGPSSPMPGASAALWLLLSINLFNYIDRQVLSAVLPQLEHDASLFTPTDPNLQLKLGGLTTAFLVSYMLLSPLFGRLGDNRSRWLLVGIGVVLWSLASGASGLATSFWILFITRCVVGVGEAAYGPVAPSMLSDMYPLNIRGKVMSWFYMAIPVGSALGYVIGSIASDFLGWRGAFLVVVVPGLFLGTLCFFKKDPRAARSAAERHGLRDYGRVLKKILKVQSFRLNTVAMTSSTFILGGVAAFAPLYIFQREAKFQFTEASLRQLAELQATDNTPVVAPVVIDKLRKGISDENYSAKQLKTELPKLGLSDAEIEQYNLRIYEFLRSPGSITLLTINTVFGAIVVVSGLTATLLGGMLGDYLRKRWSGAYFLVAGGGCLAAFPFFVGMLFAPFPLAWVFMFIAVFGLFFNTGPANTILANVVPSQIRASAFAINILIIHLFGDAISPLVIGWVADFSNLHDAFLITSFFILLAGILWTTGARHLQQDTLDAMAEERAGDSPGLANPH